MCQGYPSDMSREKFKRVLPILERARKKSRPRSADLYEMFCGVWWSVPSRGSKNAADSGTTANANLPQASIWPCSLSSSYSSKDYEQALRG